MTWTFPVLYEDSDILAVLKPAGLSTQASYDPRKENVYGLVQEQRGEKLFLHHRLDKETSGVLLLGRHSRANKGLTDLFRDHQIQKSYWALAKRGTLAPPPKTWTIKDHLAPVRGQGKNKMRMVRVKSGGWVAETKFYLQESFIDCDLIEAWPQTGRTHQIRVHLAFEKRPILGDHLYGGLGEGGPGVPRLLLHAKTLSFAHPVTKAEIKIQAPLPTDFESVLQKARLGEPISGS
ncbi:MAG: RluA family pseudouridine synthase [Bdellovibrio sp.]|jgi:23S rRNA pseudouridine955/2504/2580 synthase